MRIDPKLIIEFATIADEGSFTRAAGKLRVAQPWLSARLHKLEDILGFRLLDRTTRKVSLTEKGAEFLGAARRVSVAANDADRLALELRRRNQGVLRIGAAPYTKFGRERRDLIDAFGRAHPNISLELETGWSLALLSRLESGEIDLTFLMGDCDPERFESVVLRNYGVGLTMSPDHPLAHTKSLTAEEVAKYPVQVFTRSLYPALWNAMYDPLIEGGARLIETPDMAEGPPRRMERPHEIAAFFFYGMDNPNTSEAVHIPLAANVNIAFQLLRRHTKHSQASQDFWSLAEASRRLSSQP